MKNTTIIAVLLYTLIALSLLPQTVQAIPSWINPDVDVVYTNVSDLAGYNYSYTGGRLKVSPSATCAGAAGECVSVSFLANTTSGGTLSVELIIDGLGNLHSLSYYYPGGYEIHVLMSPPIPLNLSDLANLSNSWPPIYTNTSMYTTFYIRDNLGNSTSITLPTEVAVYGPVDVWGRYKAYQILLSEWINGSKAEDVLLLYSPEYRTFLGLTIYSQISFERPNISIPTHGGNGTSYSSPPPQPPPQPPSGTTSSEKLGTGSAILGLVFLALVIGAPAYLLYKKRSAGGSSLHAPRPPAPPPSPSGRGSEGVYRPVSSAKILVSPSILKLKQGDAGSFRVEYSCPQQCTLRVTTPRGLMVEPLEVSVEGEGSHTFTIRAGEDLKGPYVVSITADPLKVSTRLRVQVEPAPKGEKPPVERVEEPPTPGPARKREEGPPAPQPVVAPISEELPVSGYKIIKRLGSGGFSTVYLAVKEDTGEKVALKIPRIELGSTLSGSLIETFKREAETWSKLNHPNIVRVIDYGVAPIPYIAMELMEGGSLRRVLTERGRLGLKEAIKIARDVGEALSYAHHMGVVHRDIKPENILFDGEGRAKLTDFGLAKVLLQASTTGSTGFKGTLLYAAPEQIDPATFGMPDWRTDIWQLGALLYEMLTGQPPFIADNPLALAYKIVNSEPPPPSSLNPGIPEWLDQLIMKCLRKRKEERWRSVDLILERLQEGSRSLD
ncbi:MAG: serine/threonine protein kinase [Desulfurococcales archaeon]|nr:serine/threonine protein kinase [Desulfurococcales archaeon]